MCLRHFETSNMSICFRPQSYVTTRFMLCFSAWQCAFMCIFLHACHADGLDSVLSPASCVIFVSTCSWCYALYIFSCYLWHALCFFECFQIVGGDKTHSNTHTQLIVSEIRINHNINQKKMHLAVAKTRKRLKTFISLWPRATWCNCYVQNPSPKKSNLSG